MTIKANNIAAADAEALDAVFDDLFGDDGVNAEIGRLQVEVAALRAEVEHWRRCAVAWEAAATKLRDAGKPAPRRKQTSPPLVTDTFEDVDADS